MTIPELEAQLADAKERLEAALERGLNVSAPFGAVTAAERALAAARGEEYAILHDIGVTPEAAVSGAVLVQGEYHAFLTFNAMRAAADGTRKDAGTAIVELVYCHVTQFGHPNDEALPGHRLYHKGLDEGYGVYEVVNSHWIKRHTELNRVVFPSTPDSTQRHFIFTFHDSTFECICDELRVTVSQEPYARIYEKVGERATSW